MIHEFGGVFFDPSHVSDISPGQGCIWVNRGAHLRGIRVLCAPGQELNMARRCADVVNAAVSTAEQV